MIKTSKTHGISKSVTVGHIIDISAGAPKSKLERKNLDCNFWDNMNTPDNEYVTLPRKFVIR